MYNNNGNYKNGNNRNYNNGDKEYKKDYRRRTTHQKNGFPKNERVQVPISFYGYTLDGKHYESASLSNILNRLNDNDVFTIMSIPVYMKGSVVFDKPEAKNPVIVGYIKSYDDTDGTAIVSIYARSIKAFHKLEEPMIVPRVAIKQGERVCIIGLDIVDASLVTGKGEE